MKNNKLFIVSLIIIGFLAISVAGMSNNVKQHNRNDFQITTLYDGWNMVGYPNQGEISKYDITVIHNGTGYTWDDAVEQQIIINFIYGYDAEIDNYEFSDSLKGGEGYWMYVYLDCELWYVE